VAVRLKGLLGRLDHALVVAQAQVVVGAKVEHLALAALHRDGRLLRRGNHSLPLERPRGLNVLQLLLQKGLELRGPRPRPRCSRSSKAARRRGTGGDRPGKTSGVHGSHDVRMTQ